MRVKAAQRYLYTGRLFVGLAYLLVNPIIKIAMVEGSIPSHVTMLMSEGLDEPCSEGLSQVSFWSTISSFRVSYVAPL